MAKKKIWLGILVMVLVFGMTVAGCDDGYSNGSGAYQKFCVNDKIS